MSAAAARWFNQLLSLALEETDDVEEAVSAAELAFSLTGGVAESGTTITPPPMETTAALPPSDAQFGYVKDKGGIVWAGKTPPGDIGGWVELPKGPKEGSFWRRVEGYQPKTGKGPQPAPKQPGAGQQARPNHQQVTNDIRQMLQAHLSGQKPLGDDDIQSVAMTLQRMTVKDIHAVKEALKVKASGRKQQLAEKVAQRALAQVRGQLPEQQKKTPREAEQAAPQQPVTPPQAPAAPKAPEVPQKTPEPKAPEAPPEVPKAAPQAQQKPEKKQFATSPTADGLSKGFAEALAKDTKLSPEQKKSYQEAADRVFKTMPKAAIDRVVKNLKKVELYADKDTMTADYAFEILTGTASEKKKEFVRKLQREGKQIGGSYNSTLGRWRADGEVDPIEDYLGEREASVHEAYAHELGHAIDGPGYEMSSTKEWQEVWNTELVGGNLSKYAAGSSQEGFAEFSRAVYSGLLDKDTAKAFFPKATAFFEQKGLMPGAAEEAKAAEVAPVAKAAETPSAPQQTPAAATPPTPQATALTAPTAPPAEEYTPEQQPAPATQQPQAQPAAPKSTVADLPRLTPLHATRPETQKINKKTGKASSVPEVYYPDWSPGELREDLDTFDSMSEAGKKTFRQEVLNLAKQFKEGGAMTEIIGRVGTPQEQPGDRDAVNDFIDKAEVNIEEFHELDYIQSRGHAPPAGMSAKELIAEKRRSSHGASLEKLPANLEFTPPAKPASQPPAPPAAKTGKLPFQGGLTGNRPNRAVPETGRPHLTKEEAQAMQRYAMDQEQMNEFLRGGLREEWQHLEPQMKAQHAALQAAFAKAKPFDKPVTVSRDLQLDDPAAFVKQLQQKGTEKFPGYVSTTVGEGKFNANANVRLKIRATSGLDMKPYSTAPGEDELLLNHNSEFKLVNARQNANGEWEVELEQMPASAEKPQAPPARQETPTAQQPAATQQPQGTPLERGARVKRLQEVNQRANELFKALHPEGGKPPPNAEQIGEELMALRAEQRQLDPDNTLLTQQEKPAVTQQGPRVEPEAIMETLMAGDLEQVANIDHADFNDFKNDLFAGKYGATAHKAAEKAMDEWIESGGKASNKREIFSKWLSKMRKAQ